jgi:alpha-beta hydrolase superfamily lysophospholipase
VGGTICALFFHESREADLVKGLILDAPLLDPGSVVDADAHAHNVPGFIDGWAKGLATLRFGVDWGSLNQLEHADEFTVPILLLQGDADTEASVAFPAAGHTESWNVDPARYEAVLAAFVTEVAGGPVAAPTAGGGG